jgi:hypothetical protein
MTTTLLIIFLIISLGLNVSAYIIIKRLLSKIETYEDWILEFKNDLVTTLTKMRSIDKQGTFATSMNTEGTFESDDQVGQIFKELLDLTEKLNDRTE